MTPQEQQQLIALSNERDLWSRWLLDAWREGYAAAMAECADDYARGWVDGVRARKSVQRTLVDDARAYARRWGPLGRAGFGRPRAGDFPGRGAPGAAR